MPCYEMLCAGRFSVFLEIQSQPEVVLSFYDYKHKIQCVFAELTLMLHER